MIQQGYCRCGCGQETSIVASDDKAQGLRKGERRRFVHGHYHRWMKRHCPGWGDPGREKCFKAADRVCRSITENRYDEIIGVAFQAAMESPYRNGCIRDIEDACRDAVKKHFYQQISYGCVSVEALRDAGIELVAEAA